MKNLNSKKILVTGGAGFIGCHLVNRLTDGGCGVVVVDNLSSGKKENLNSEARFYQMDIKDSGFWDVLEKEKIEVVFHLAAQPLVERAYLNPIETLNTNIMGTANVLEACRKTGTEAVIIASSDKAYGKSQNLPYKEEDFLRGDHPYSFSKTGTDLLSQTYFKTYLLPVAISRFGNIFGPRDTNFNRIIPGILEAIIKNKELLIRSDGNMIREYIYVEDVVRGYIMMVENIDEIKGEAFNFGSRNIYSILDLVKEVEKILGAKVKYKIMNNAKNEIKEQYLDWDKANRVLGWEPKTTFEEGVRKSFEWYKKFLK